MFKVLTKDTDDIVVVYDVKEYLGSTNTISFLIFNNNTWRYVDSRMFKEYIDEKFG